MKAFLDSEIYQVQSEANELHEDWGTNIWSQAFQFHHVSCCFFIIKNLYSFIFVLVRYRY